MGVGFLADPATTSTLIRCSTLWQTTAGATLTHSLANGSPAIDAGDPAFDPYDYNPPLLYDQRGPGFRPGGW